MVKEVQTFANWSREFRVVILSSQSLNECTCGLNVERGGDIITRVSILSIGLAICGLGPVYRLSKKETDLFNIRSNLHGFPV
jgi:hypothetical protein